MSEKRQYKKVLLEHPNRAMIDNGGRRLGFQRRVFSYHIYYPERRSGVDRRSGIERRMRLNWRSKSFLGEPFDKIYPRPEGKF